MYYTLHQLLICLIMICSLLGCSLVSQTASPASPSADLSSLVTPTSLTSTATPTTSPTLSPTETAKPTSTATSSATATQTQAPTWTHFPTKTPRPTYTASPTASPTLTPFIEPPPFPESLPHPPLGYRWASWGFRQSALDGELLFQDRGQLVALSATDGQMRWWYDLPEGERINAIVTTKESVFILTYQPLEANARQLGVVALSKDGQLRWQREFPAARTYGWRGQAIYATQETVYVSDHFAKKLVTLNATDGAIRWQKYGECYRPRLAIEGALFVLCRGNLIKLDEATGEIMMRRGIKSLKDVASSEEFLVTMSLVEVDSPDRVHLLYNTLIEVWQEPFSHGSLWEKVWQEDSGSLLWEHEVPGSPAGLWRDETTLAYRAGNTVRRVRLTDGELLWETRLPEERGTNLLRVGEVLLVGSMAGYLHALDWESGFRLWSQDLWTSLEPHSLHITVLGASEEGIFLKMIPGGFVVLATQEQEKQGAIARIASTWPTATPTPTFTPQPTTSILPLPFISAPAEDWTAPPLSEMPRDSREELTQAHLRVLSDFLNTMPDNVEEAVAQYTTWAWPDFEQTFRPFVHAADLDRDGSLEWIVAILPPTNEPDPVCFITFCPQLIIIFEYQQGLLIPSYILNKNQPTEMSNPQIITVEDLNGDSQIELVLSTSHCGAHTCFTELHIGQWDGQQWHDLGSMSQSYSEISILDQDGDGSKEILMYGGTVGSVGGGMHRARTEVYAWKEGRYQQIAEIPDFIPDNIYFLMLDAHAALMNQDWDKALDLAMTVVTEPNLQPKGNDYRFSDSERSRIVSYAAILAMLVHTQQGEVGAIEALLREVETRYDQVENPYVEAAQRLWYTYRDTQDPLLACQAVERTAREQQERAQFILWYGYATERLPIKQICPFDD